MRLSATRLTDALMRCAPAAAAWIAGSAAAAIAAFLLVSVWPLLVSGRVLETLTAPWRPFAAEPTYGIGAMILTSVVISTGAVALAFPASLGLVAFIEGIGPARLRPSVLRLVRFMTSIPTVVYGFVAVIVLVPTLRATAGGTGYNLLGATGMLALLVTPTIVLVLQAHLARSGRDPLTAGLALGMTPAQTLAHVVLPAARSSAVAALVLGFCRAVGDTLIALMIAGNAVEAPDSLLDSARALTAHIALVLATDSFSPEYRSVAGAAALLFLLTAGMSLAMRRFERNGGSG